MVMSAVLVWDVFVIPRIASSDCHVYGRAAEALGVPDGSRVDPDSGGCRAYGCSDEIVTADRVLLSDYRSVEMFRSNC